MKICPCGSNQRYMDCCGLYIQKNKPAETPDILMRSRYSAFVEGNIPYIKKTMRGPALIGFNKQNFEEDITWLELEVISTEQDPKTPNEGFVEFKAKYQTKNKQPFSKTSTPEFQHENHPLRRGSTPKASGGCSQTETLHEKSKFEKINGKWYYVSGEHF